MVVLCDSSCVVVLHDSSCVVALRDSSCVVVLHDSKHIELRDILRLEIDWKGVLGCSASETEESFYFPLN